DDVVDDCDTAGRRIDLDFGKMGAVRIGAVGGGKGGAGVEFRRIDPRALGEICKADRAVGAGDTDGAAVDFEIAYACFERFGGDLAQLFSKFVRGALDADTAGRNRGRTAGAKSGRDLVGVALEDVDALRRQAELIGNDLRI